VKRVISNRWFKLSAGLVLLLFVGLISCAWYFRIWSWRDLQVYQMMSQECHPVWRDLYWGRIHSGQNVEDVIEATQPVRVERYGEFVRLNYQESLSFTGVTIMAKNGRLASASAWSCTWNRVFFDELTQEDWKAYSDAYEAHWQPIRKKREEAEQQGAAPDRGGM
jgi:hypothetical protein